jgi:hypothetical protein
MICAGHAGVLSLALGRMVPENCGVGRGGTRLSRNSAAEGEPGVSWCTGSDAKTAKLLTAMRS